MKRLTHFVYFLVLLCLAACDQASDTLVDVPNVTVNCVPSTASICNAGINGKQVRVIMTRSGCANFDFDPVASSTSSLACTSSGCEATLSSWVDANQNQVEQIITGNMNLCGLIDLDGDFQEDSGELEHASEVNIQTDGVILIQSWSTI